MLTIADNLQLMVRAQSECGAFSEEMSSTIGRQVSRDGPILTTVPA